MKPLQQLVYMRIESPLHYYCLKKAKLPAPNNGVKTYLKSDSNWYLLTLRVKKIFCDFKNNLAPIVLHLLRGTLFCNKRWILRQFCRSSHLGVCRVSITHECCICSTFSGKENFPFPLYSIYLCCFPSKVKWRSMTLMFSKCWSKKGSILKTLNIGRQGVF